MNHLRECEKRILQYFRNVHNDIVIRNWKHIQLRFIIEL